MEEEDEEEEEGELPFKNVLDPDFADRVGAVVPTGEDEDDEVGGQTLAAGGSLYVYIHKLVMCWSSPTASVPSCPPERTRAMRSVPGWLGVGS